MNEHLFTLSLIRDGHDPVTTTTILTHDSIDKANVSITLRVDHGGILTSYHRREDGVEVILTDSVCSAKHFFSLSFGDDECIVQESFYLSNPVKVSANSLPNNVSRVRRERSDRNVSNEQRIISKSQNHFSTHTFSEG
jgi:hypothetical protein